MDKQLKAILVFLLTFSALIVWAQMPILPGVLQPNGVSAPAGIQFQQVANSPFTISSVAAHSGATTVYTGTITGGTSNAYANLLVDFTSCTNAANNGYFVASASSVTTVTVNNGAGVVESSSTCSLQIYNAGPWSSGATSGTYNLTIKSTPAGALGVVLMSQPDNTGTPSVPTTSSGTWVASCGTVYNGSNYPQTPFHLANMNSGITTITMHPTSSTSHGIYAILINAATSSPVDACQPTGSLGNGSGSTWYGYITTTTQSNDFVLGWTYSEVRANNGLSCTGKWAICIDAPTTDGAETFGVLSIPAVSSQFIPQGNQTSGNTLYSALVSYKGATGGTASGSRATGWINGSAGTNGSTVAVADLASETYQVASGIWSCYSSNPCAMTYTNAFEPLLNRNLSITGVTYTPAAYLGFRYNLNAATTSFPRIAWTLSASLISMGEYINVESDLTNGGYDLADAEGGGERTQVLETDTGTGTITGEMETADTANNPFTGGVSLTPGTSYWVTWELDATAGATVTTTAVANASGGTTVYTGTFTGGGSNAFTGAWANITSCAQTANNGLFQVTASTAAALTVTNPSGVTDTTCTVKLHNQLMAYYSGCPSSCTIVGSKIHAFSVATGGSVGNSGFGRLGTEINRENVNVDHSGPVWDYAVGTDSNGVLHPVWPLMP